ncbi:MAG: 30S ribosome-binding factor RbfA [Treponemataceae bacterium]|jgi:ribosome-binding factor A|nr:30S ribosome-binding factor RbfA [Treponemataceae bacterium]
MSEFRLTRLGEQVREEISQMILRQQIKDPRVSTFLSINRVEITSDLSYGKVYVSSFMSHKETLKGVKGLESAAGFIQTKLSKKLRLRQFPKLTFIMDSSIEEGFEMVRKLKEQEESRVEEPEEETSESEN